MWLIKGGGIAEKIIQAGDFVKVEISGERYGIQEHGSKAVIFGCPVRDNGGKIVGTWILVYPQYHPVVRSFDLLTSILEGMFKNRVGLYLTNKNEIIRVNKTLAENYTLIAFCQKGAKLTEHGTAKQAISSNTVVFKRVPEDTFGIPVDLVSYPIEIDGDVIGTISMIINRTLNERVKHHVFNLSRAIEEIAAAVEQVAASVSEVVAQQSRVVEMIAKISSGSIEIEKITEFIKEVAGETKLLGLNAVIEAARAGEVGRGFGVVADEIRKLSEQTKTTSESIKTFLADIKTQLEETYFAADKTVQTAEQQAAAVEEISASIEEIRAMVEELAKQAEEL